MVLIASNRAAARELSLGPFMVVSQFPQSNQGTPDRGAEASRTRLDRATVVGDQQSLHLSVVRSDRTRSRTASGRGGGDRVPVVRRRADGPGYRRLHGATKKHY